MTLETLPDKKMGVGSLRNPREYDGRLPPDAGYYLDLVIPRKKEPRKKTRACYNNTMEDYEYKVIKSHATQSQNSSKSTSNISKNTSKSTSKTNQIKVRGAMGGLNPPTEPLPGLYSPPQRGGAGLGTECSLGRKSSRRTTGYWLDY